MQVINDYNNKPLKYGTRDCHLMVLDAYGYSDLADQIRGSYTTIRGGHRVAKKLELPYVNLEQLLESTWETVVGVFKRFGDVGLNPENRVACVILSNGVFVADIDDTFKLMPLSVIDNDNYKFYRYIGE